MELSLCLIISVGFLTKYGFMMDFNVFKRNIYVKKPICNIGEVSAT